MYRLQSMLVLKRYVISRYFQNQDEKRAYIPTCIYTVKKEGPGIHRTAGFALHAFLASIHSVHDLLTTVVPNVNLDDAISDAATRGCQLTGLTDTPVRPKLQKQWDQLLVQKAHAALLAVTERDRVRLLALLASESEVWLHTLPIPSLGTPPPPLDDNSLRILMALRLGADLCAAHQCRCKTLVSPSAHHGLNCNKNTDRYSRRTPLSMTLSTARCYRFPSLYSSSHRVSIVRPTKSRTTELWHHGSVAKPSPGTPSASTPWLHRIYCRLFHRGGPCGDSC